MRDTDESLLRDFLAESTEGVDQLDADLLALERDPSEKGAVASAFRTLHTIKGNAGILGLGELEALAHAGEGVLGCVRDGRLPLTADVADALLLTVDAVRRLLDEIERTGAEPAGRYAPLRARLTALCDGSMNEAGASSRASGEPPDARAEGAAARVPRHDGTIRIRTPLLNRLMNLVGELLLARNQLLEESESSVGRPTPAVQRVDAIAAEIEDSVVRMRLQPIDRVLAPIPRMVRDLAVACGKDVRVEIEGRNTELDRTVIDAVKDPVTHLVRNALAHGIETPAERAACGKPRAGRLRVRALHEAGQVVIEVSDDGRGIDPAKVARVAVAQGLLADDAIARLSQEEALRLIFLPGVSTAEAVTSVAGRGVGLDVVRTNLERIGGTVDVRSSPGAGTTFRITVPLTLAIVPALLVFDGSDRYALAQAAVVEVLQLDGSGGRGALEPIGGASVCRLRGELLPLVALSELVLGAGAPSAPSTPSQTCEASVVVLQAGSRRVGLVVGGVGETQEIVVRPLPRAVQGVPFFTGAAILGDGRVALVLDAASVVQRAGSDAGTAPGGETAAASAAASRAREAFSVVDRRSAFVVVEAGGGRAAIPLARVARLEEIAAESVGTLRDGEAIPYHGAPLRLVRLAPDTGPTRPAPAPLSVLVCDGPAERVGVVVDRIVDIVDIDGATIVRGSAPGRTAAAVIDGRVTDLVDLGDLLGAA